MPDVVNVNDFQLWILNANVIFCGEEERISASLKPVRKTDFQFAAEDALASAALVEFSDKALLSKSLIPIEVFENDRAPDMRMVCLFRCFAIRFLSTRNRFDIFDCRTLITKFLFSLHSFCLL